VHVEEQGIALPGLEAEGLHDPGVHRQAGALEAEALRSTQGDLPLPVPVEIGEPPLAAAVGAADEELGGSVGLARREGQGRAVGGRGEAADDPLARDDPGDRAARRRDPVALWMLRSVLNQG